MKYYYGNSYKEALANDPVELTTIEQYQQYTDNYSVVIPVSDQGLPIKVVFSAVEVDIDETCLDDKEAMEDILADHLSDDFGYCVNSFSYEIKKDESGQPIEYICNDIDWDTSEEEE